MKKLISLFTFAILMGLPLSAQAGSYAVFATQDVTYDVDNFNQDSDTGFQIAYGYEVDFILNFGVEVSYSDLGQLSTEAGDLYDRSDLTQLSATGKFALLNLPFVAAYVRGGMAITSIDREYNTQTSYVSVSESSTHPIYGVGANFVLPVVGLGVRTEYMLHQADFDISGELDFTTMSIGLEYHF